MFSHAYTLKSREWPGVLMYVSLVMCSQDHDELVRAREDYEKQLQEQKVALDEQKKRYEEMEVRLTSNCRPFYRQASYQLHSSCYSTLWLALFTHTCVYLAIHTSAIIAHD